MIPFHLSMVMVTSLDGVAVPANFNTPLQWNSKEDRRHFVRITKEIGTVIMGSRTFESNGRKVLPGRRNVLLTSHPERYEPQEDLLILEGSPHQVVEELYRRGIEKAALIGGPNANQQFLEARLVNEILLTTEPRLFGEGEGVTTGALDLKLETIEHTILNPEGTMLSHHRVIY